MHKATSILILAVIISGGCKSSGFLAKREAEKCCPTDIRKTVPWCAGEDALFQCPCEPSAAFYGYKPTCWRTWPANGAAWRDLHCGNEHHHAVIKDLTHQNPELIPLPPLQSAPTPAAETEADKQGEDSDQVPEIQVPKVQIKAEPAPEPPQLPEMKEEVRREPSALPADSLELKRYEVEKPESDDEALPTPVLGPIPLPPIESEYAE